MAHTVTTNRLPRHDAAPAGHDHCGQGEVAGNAKSSAICGRSPHSPIGRGALALTVVFLVILGIPLLAAGCGGSSTNTTSVPETTAGPGTTSSAGGATVQVIMTDRSYSPQTVTINVGDTVTWVNEDAPQHDVVADNGEFKSGLFDKGGTFSFTFTTAGTYPYHCSIHPGMVGTVVVQ
jgi:plastocyanin